MMKKIYVSLTTVAIIGLVLYIIFLKECRRPTETSIPDGYVLITQSSLDSMEAVAKMPGDTVYIDTGSTIIKIEYRSRPVPIPIDDEAEINLYSDSIVNDTVNFWIQAKIKGELLDWSWKFDIPQKVITKIIEIPKPVPVSVKIEVPVIKNGLYPSLGIGGGLHTGKLMIGAGLDLITKKDNLYGLHYRRFGEDNLVEFKIGANLRNLFNR